MIPRSIDQLLSQQPGTVGAWYNAYKEYRWGDPCLRLISSLADRTRLAVDVGANVGTYSFFMRRYARRCIAYECNPELVELLQGRFGRSIDIRAAAVSDQRGDVTLRIPRSNVGKGIGRATIEPENPLDGDFQGMDEFIVQRVVLDDEIDEPVGLIKVDVEGHELAVLHGARSIIERDHPTLILELEDRHKPGCVEEAFGFLSDRGYRGMSLKDGKLVAAESHAIMQPIGTVNYVFIPEKI